jgi:hypothetical protein
MIAEDSYKAWLVYYYLLNAVMDKAGYADNLSISLIASSLSL